ncbi:hypothetical protein CBS101457_005892 [Exobasidium rhododendri]|nr:hypothetical protein CBS101457_005892 [Exobasidium rhododendri]
MTPAPGPLAPPSDPATQAALPNDASTDSAASTSSYHTTREERSMPLTSGGPKTCFRCGRHMESTELSVSSESAFNAAAPSPSSVAFVSSASTPLHISSVLSGAALPSESDAMILDEASHPICSSCTASERGGRESSTSRERRRQLSLARDVVEGVGDRDSVASGEQPSSGSSMVATPDGAASASRTRDPSLHPWRRDPWATGTSSEAVPMSSNSSTSTLMNPSLSISVSNMGAGGDGTYASSIDNSEDFPPLPRSPQASSTFNPAHSPRLALSPTFARSSTLPSTTPSATLARQLSFSRSQASTAAIHAPTSPTVNFPSRGRNRADSASSSTGAQVAPSHHQVRRPSIHRIPSRPYASQDPANATLVEDPSSSSEGMKAAEDPYGPSAMTRPRLSTLTPRQMSKGAASKIVLPDWSVKTSYDANSDDNEDEEERTRRVIWFRYNKAEPRQEISKLRCSSRGRGCLFAGAKFNGTQKSGRMSYDVTVQIVNVDMASSNLCGYLNIRGLTDDWPELTTYFDAEIIGHRYGFVTNKWGATEADDMKHWGRFAPFRPLKNSLTKPGLHFNHMNKPFIFMRWKERFLVPDHRVRDIDGASFAGFYYVCVELGEEEGSGSQIGPAINTPASPVPRGGSNSNAATLPSLPAAPVFTRQRSASSRRRQSTAGYAATGADDRGLEHGRGGAALPERPLNASPMEGLETEEGNATTAATTMGRMSGFYFHEHSEPYQQLTLQHVAEKSSSTFELR